MKIYLTPMHLNQLFIYQVHPSLNFILMSLFILDYYTSHHQHSIAWYKIKNKATNFNIMMMHELHKKNNN